MRHPYYSTAAQEQHQAAKERREQEALAYIQRVRIAEKAKRILHVS